MARLGKIIALMLLMSILACIGNRYADTNIFKSQIASINQEINHLNQEINQVNAAADVAERNEKKLMGSLRLEELPVYEQLKASRLQQNVVQYTQLLESYKYYLKVNYPPAVAANRLENVILVIDEINNNYIKKYKLTMELQQRNIELERLKRDIALNTPK